MAIIHITLRNFEDNMMNHCIFNRSRIAQDCLERFDKIDMKNISLKELKRTRFIEMEMKRTLDLLDLLERSFEDIQLNQLVGVMNQLIYWADELQNLGLMSFRTKNIQNFYTNDYMFTFSRYRNFRARNYHLKSSNIWKKLCIKESQHQVLLQNEYGKLLKEMQMNSTTANKLLSLHNNEPCVDIESTQPLANEGKITPKLKDNFTSSKNPNKQKHKKSMPKSHPKFQLKRNEIARHVSFVLVMSIIFVGPFFDMWIEPSLMKVQHGQAWVSSLRFLGFMVFVLAVATMILVGVPFVGMQTFVLTFWAIWMHVKP